MRKNRLFLFLGVLVLSALVVIGGGQLVLSELARQQAANAPFSGTVLPESRPLPDVTLVDHNNTPLPTQALAQDWQILFFGFTSCPDVCPMTLAQLTGVLVELEEQAPEAVPEVLFVSVDPNRDSPTLLKQYVEHFHPNIRGATGTRDAIDTLTASLGISYTLHEPDEDGQYAVDHSAAVLLIDPSGGMKAVWNPPHGRSAIVNDFLRVTGATQ